VTAEDFRGLDVWDDLDAWIPLAMEATARTLFPIWKSDFFDGVLTTIGRIGPGVSPDAAQAELDVLAARIAEPHRRTGTRGSLVMDPNVRTQQFQNGVAMYRIRPIAGVSGLLLLLACVNIAGLLLVQAMERRREISYRCALGAGRGRIVRQLLTESVVLAVPGAIVGLVVARWMGWGLERYVAEGIHLPLDLRVVAFAVTTAVVATLLFGLVPALHVLRSSGTAPTLGASGVVSRPRVLSGLAMTQVALTVLLLTVGGTFVKRFLAADNVDPGFEMTGLLLVEPNMRIGGRTGTEIRDFYHLLVDRLATVPGVAGVAAAGTVPRVANRLGWGGRTVRAEGVDREEAMSVEYNEVSPTYFETMGIELVRGRGIRASDDTTSALVGVVNQTMAHQLWGSDDPVGGSVRAVRRQGDGDPIEIVGVVRDTRTFLLRDAVPPELYVPVEQYGVPNLTVAVRATGPLDEVAGAIRAEIRALDPALPPVTIESMADRLANRLVEERSWADVASAFGSVALLLALIGLYGTMAFSVSQRAREFGVRIALGAAPREVVGHVFHRGLSIAMTGGVAGLLLAFALTPLLTGYVNEDLGNMGTRPDLTIVAGCLVVLGIAATAACWGPARNATKVDPMVILRHD